MLYPAGGSNYWQGIFMSGIYALLCLLTGKIYVGSGVVWKARIRDHRYDLTRKGHCNSHLQSAWNKYGPDAFVGMLLEPCAEADLREREQWWINQLNSGDPRFGFNMAAVIKQPVPAPVMSAIMKGYWKELSREESIARHFYKWTDKGRQLLRNNAIAQWADPEFKASMPAKVSATMKEYCKDSAVREHRTAISRGYWSSPEAKAKMSARMKKQWGALSPEERTARSKITPRETTRFFTLKGITKPIKVWSKDSGLPYGLLLTRLTTGCEADKFFAPSRNYKPKPKFVRVWLT